VAPPSSTRGSRAAGGGKPSPVSPPPLPPPLDRVRHPSVPDDSARLLGLIQLPTPNDRPPAAVAGKPKRPGSASSRGDARLQAGTPVMSPGWDAASMAGSSVSAAFQDASSASSPYELEDFKRTSIRKSFHDLIHKRKKKTKPT